MTRVTLFPFIFFVTFKTGSEAKPLMIKIKIPMLPSYEAGFYDTERAFLSHKVMPLYLAKPRENCFPAG